jgi:Ca-activated chloride channel homolog
VYTTLSAKLTLQKKDTEISGLMALLGAALALLSAGLSVFWFSRVL